MKYKPENMDIIMKGRHDVTMPVYKKYKCCPFCYAKLTLYERYRLKLRKKVICYNCKKPIHYNDFIVY